MFPRPTCLTLLLPGLFLAWMPLLEAWAADPADDKAELARAWKEGQRFRSARTPVGIRQPGIVCLAFAPGGGLLATGGDQQVNLWKTRDWSLHGRLPVPASCWLAFSPDQRWLYVASLATVERGDSGRLARFDWQTGRLDRSYPADITARSRFELSGDGKRLAVALGAAGRLLLLETETGRLLYNGEASQDRPAVSLGLDGQTLLRTRDQLSGPAGTKEESTPAWLLTALDKERVVSGTNPQPGVVRQAGPSFDRELTGKVFWQFSPTGRYLLSGMAPQAERDGVTLRLHNPRDQRELARKHDLCFGSWLTFSGDGERLAAASQDRDPDSDLCQSIRGGLRFSVLSAPDLRLLRRWDVMGDSGSRLQALALSADGRMLGTVNRDHPWGPSLFDTTTGRRILSSANHTGTIRSVHFLPDGRTLRSIDSDGVVCLWDLPSMRLRDRLAIPPHCAVLASRPSDGKYLLCRLPTVHRRQQTLGMVDTDTGCLICSFPGSWWIDQPLVLWLSDVQAFLIERRRVIRIDCQRGDFLEEHRIDRDAPRREAWRGDWQPEHLQFNWVNGDSERGQYEGCRLDVESGLLLADDLELPQRAFRHFGAVPGGRWFYAADPDLFLIDRETRKVQARPALGKARIDTLAFTADGGCVALACSDPKEQPATGRPKHLLRIHDTISGRLLAALPGAESIVQMRFSRDGRRLALVHEDDTIEVWDLPGLVRR